MKFADLHIHTNKSDSTFSPQEIIRYASKVGLCAIAITDHDSVAAIPFMEKYSKKYEIEIIPGVELSSDINGTEVHILGYFINISEKWFLEKLEFLRDTRTKRAKEIIRKLNELNINVTIDDVMALSGEGAIGRMHIARLLLDKKYVYSIPEAFQRFIGKGKYAYVEKYRLTPKENIDIIKKLKGIPVLAHPGIMNQDKFIPELIKEGLLGIEAYHTDHTKDAVKKYLSLAGKYNLLVTGGSDCHGIGKGKVLIGTVKIPYELVEKLKEKRGR